MSLIFSSPSKTFLQCFTLQQRQCKAKHCRNVLGRVLGQKNKIQKLSLRIRVKQNAKVRVFRVYSLLWVG